MDNAQTDKLEPCPFCGGEGELIVRDYADDRADVGNAYVECRGCGVETAWRLSGGNAITAWNTRHHEAEIAAAVERERERCAQVAESCPWPDHGYQIATAIRQQKDTRS